MERGETIKNKETQLQRYINIRLGNLPEVEQLEAMFEKSFRASSYRKFWWYWNPVYNYFLTKYIYRPLKKILPNSISMLITFLASGFLLHDLPIMLIILVTAKLILPFPTTIFFIVLGTTVIVSENLKLNFVHIQPKNRIIIHLGTIVFSFILSLSLVIILLIKYKDYLILP